MTCNVSLLLHSLLELSHQRQTQHLQLQARLSDSSTHYVSVEGIAVSPVPPPPPLGICTYYATVTLGLYPTAHGRCSFTSMSCNGSATSEGTDFFQRTCSIGLNLLVCMWLSHAYVKTLYRLITMTLLR